MNKKIVTCNKFKNIFSKPDQMEQPTQALQGTLILKPLEAKLERNLHAFIKMDPYCVGLIGATQIKGQVCKNGGLNPFWTNAILLQLRADEPCFIEVKDRQVLTGDSTIGICEIDRQQLMEEKNVTRWYDLYFRKKPVGQLLIEGTYTEQNYGSKHVVYTKAKNPRQEQYQLPSRAAQQKHIPGAHEQESMRGSVATKLSASPTKGRNSANPDTLRNSPGQENQAENQPIPQEPHAQQPVAATQDNLAAQPTKKKKKGWLKSIKSMFGSEGGKKSKSAKEQGETADGLVPLRRRKPEGLEAQFASVGGVPSDTPAEILERKVPEQPKLSLKDYLEKENSNQVNRPEPVMVRREISEKSQTAAANSNLKDQYRSVGAPQSEQIRKPSPILRLSDMTKGNVVVRDFGELDKETPDWKANQVAAAGGFFGQTQPIQPVQPVQDLKSYSMAAAPVSRRFEDTPSVPLYKYR